MPHKSDDREIKPLRISRSLRQRDLNSSETHFEEISSRKCSSSTKHPFCEACFPSCSLRAAFSKWAAVWCTVQFFRFAVSIFKSTRADSGGACPLHRWKTCFPAFTTLSTSSSESWIFNGTVIFRMLSLYFLRYSIESCFKTPGSKFRSELTLKRIVPESDTWPPPSG